METRKLPEVQPGRTHIGWIGTGSMGRYMCGRLLDAGYAVAVYNRTREKVLPLLEKGARWADAPGQVATGADVVFTIVGAPSDVRQVYLEPGGIIDNLKPGAVAVDMTTSSPSLAGEIAAAARQRGCWALDAPVSGGDVGARDGALSVMVGGEAPALQAVRPLLDLMGKTVMHQGGPGAGQHAKICNQIVISGSMIGVCQSLLYAVASGLDPQVVLASLLGGTARCWTLEKLGPRILAGDFEPGFMIDHFVKDLGIALDEARRMGLVLPGLVEAEVLFREAQTLGLGQKSTHGLYLALKKLSGRE